MFTSVSSAVDKPRQWQVQFFHRAKIPVQEWFWPAYLVATHTPGISAKQLQRQPWLLPLPLEKNHL